MIPSKLIGLLNAVEESCDRININYHGIDCWPVIRNSLIGFLGKKNQRREKKKYGLYNFLICFCRSLFSFFKIRKCNELFVTDEKYTEKINFINYFKDIHVLCEEAINNDRKISIAIQGSGSGEKNRYRKNVFSIYPIVSISAIITKLIKSFMLSSDLESYISSLCDSFVDHGLICDDIIDRDELVKIFRWNIYYCVILRFFFRLLISILNIDKCYVVCYYSFVGMSLCSACNSKNVYIADVQHGISGRYMGAYSKWPCSRNRSFNTLPNMFLCWTNFDFTHMKEWISDKECDLRVELIKKTWRDYLRDKGLYEKSMQEWKAFFDSHLKYRYKVAITLQFLNVSHDVIRLIENVDNNVCFYVRIHPDFKIEEFSRNLLNIFSNYNNVYYYEPSCMPISVLLSNVDIHLTEWSSCVYDAYAEKIISLVTDESSKDYFYDLISFGYVSYVGEENSIMKYLN